jgi:hypothetical protein
MSSTSSQFYQLSNMQLNHLITERARFKQRSHDTHTHVHRPQLESSPSTISSATISPEFLPQIDIVLLGSSTLERFKTTGKHTQIGQLPYPHVFNAGVGGDKIENVLYRVDLGLLNLLKLRNPKLVVLQVGTNNLRPKQGLERQHLDDYYLLLQAVLRILSARTQILVTGFFKRTDIDDQFVMQSNLALKELVVRISTKETTEQMQHNHRVH